MKNPNLWIQCFCHNAAVLLPLGLWLLLADWLLKCSLKPIKVSVCVWLCVVCCIYTFPYELVEIVLECMECIVFIFYSLSVSSVRCCWVSVAASAHPKWNQPININSLSFRFTIYNTKWVVVCVPRRQHLIPFHPFRQSHRFSFVSCYSEWNILTEPFDWKRKNGERWTAAHREDRQRLPFVSGENGTCQSAHDKI